MTVSPHQPPIAKAMHERTVAEAWPSISAGPIGRRLGRWFSIRTGVRVGGVPLTVGWGLAAVLAPLAGMLYLARKAPRWPLLFLGPVNPAAVRYRLTTARVVVESPTERRRAPAASLPLADFDVVEVEELPGQGWYHAADVVFRRAGQELLRLPGVPRPEPFIRTVLKTKQAMAASG